MKFYKIPIILFIVWLSFNPANQHKICNVTVYCETLCFMSRDFAVKQIPAAYKNLQDYIYFDYVPFGSATITEKNGKYNCTCQHGPQECYGNLMQTCALWALKQKYKNYDKNYTSAMVKYISNFMAIQPPFSTNSSKYCPEPNDKVMLKQFNDCITNGSGYKMMAENEKRTVQAQPKGIPYVTVNKENNNNVSQHARINLTQFCCEEIKQMPQKCERDCKNQIKSF